MARARREGGKRGARAPGRVGRWEDGAAALSLHRLRQMFGALKMKSD